MKRWKNPRYAKDSLNELFYDKAVFYMTLVKLPKVILQPDLELDI